jgi:hypothetical protein
MAMTIPALQKKRGSRGAVAVECALVLPLVVAVLGVVIQCGLLAIERQLTNYAGFMAARARMVDRDPRAAARRVLPWLSLAWDTQQVKVVGHRAVLHGRPLGRGYQMEAEVPVVRHPQSGDGDEDNSLCAGGGSC